MKKIFIAVQLLLTFVTSSMGQNETMHVPIVHFRPCPGNETVGHFIPIRKLAKKLDNLSFCFRFRIKIWDVRIHLLDSHSFCLVLPSIDNKAYFAFINGLSLALEFDLKEALVVSPNAWNSFCLSYNGSSTNMKMAVNGITLFDKIVTLPGLLSSINMSYIEIGKHHGYEGYITEVNFWSSSLSIDEIKLFSSSQQESLLKTNQPDILTWSEVDLKQQNNCSNTDWINAKSFSMGNAMNNKQEYILLKMLDSYEGALKKCSAMNGRMFYPKDKKHLESIKLIMPRILDSYCESSLWVPFLNKKRTSIEWTQDKKWKKDKRVDFGPWKVDINQTGHCMYFNASSETYIPVKCDLPGSYKCVICEMDRERLIFNFQSKCRMSVNYIDDKFILTQEDLQFYWTGQTGISHIQGDHEFWKLENYPHRRVENVAIATLESSASPFGIKQWNIESCKGGKLSLVKLSNCWGNEFTCESGECIPLERRCDAIADCEGNYDEKNCTLIKADEDLYQSDTSPLEKHSKTTDVTVNVTIKDFGAIDEIEQSFQLRFFLQLQWFDWRLSFVNLKNETSANALKGMDRYKVWIPNLVFENDAKGDYVRVLPLSVLMVQKEGNPELKFDSNLNKYLEYKGTENPILFENIYDMKLMCELELHLYPFDSQTCYIKMSAPLRSALKLVSGKVQNMGNTQLPQFEVVSVQSDSQTRESGLDVKITLCRIIWYFITNTFIPTTSLVIVSEFTLLFHEDHLMASAGLTLTVMLVMYTIYQSIVEAMTETAYLKMLDYWLLFCLLTPFTIFMIEVFWILKKSASEDSKNRWYRKILDPVLREGFVRIFIPTITCLFMLLYTFVAAVIINFRP